MSRGHELPQGPACRRYNHDGYGQKENGRAFHGAGVGGCWALLTGERGHYELAAGRDPLPYIHAMEGFSNAGSMLPEQVWVLSRERIQTWRADRLSHAAPLGPRGVSIVSAKPRTRVSL